MSDTPETDALSKKQYIRMAASSNDVSDLLFGALKEMEDHARKLERERDEAREKLRMANIEANARQEIANALKERDEYKQERDEARERAQQMSESNQVLMADARFYRKAWELGNNARRLQDEN